MFEKTKTVVEVAEFLGISERSVRTYIKTGKLAAYSIGGSYRITEESITAFLQKSFINKGDQNNGKEIR